MTQSNQVVKSFIFFEMGGLLFIDLFLVVLGLHCYLQTFSSCGKWGILFVAAVPGLLIEVASLVSEHRLSVAGASRVAVHRLRGCGMQT